MEVSQLNAAGLGSLPELNRKTNGIAFNEVVEKFLRDVNNQQVNADAAVQKLVSGETDNVQEVMLALNQADLSFRMFMELRNKMTDAYQEVMRMQL